jgi:hypothetical protein
MFTDCLFPIHHIKLSSKRFLALWILLQAKDNFKPKLASKKGEFG